MRQGKVKQSGVQRRRLVLACLLGCFARPLGRVLVLDFGLARLSDQAPE